LRIPKYAFRTFSQSTPNHRRHTISQQTPSTPISQVLVGKFFHTPFSDQTETPQVGDDVLIIKRRNDKQPRVYSPDMKLLGTIQINSNLPGGLAFGRVEPALMIRINID
jgi:hypothetical protein